MLILPDENGVVLIEFEHAADADTDGWFAPDEILDRVETRYDDLDALLADLAERSVDSEVFDAPWKMDFPL